MNNTEKNTVHIEAGITRAAAIVQIKKAFTEKK